MNPNHITTATPLPPLSKKDRDYIEGNYVSIEELCLGRNLSAEEVRNAISERKLPLPSYVLEDRLMVPVTYLALYEEAGSFDEMPSVFARRWRSATRCVNLVQDDPHEVWQEYLSGELGICLWDPTPESIVAKLVAMKNINTLLSEPKPDDRAWCKGLRIWIKRLDLIERPFAEADEIRFGIRSSRSRLIEDPKLAFPHIFESA